MIATGCLAVGRVRTVEYERKAARGTSSTTLINGLKEHKNFTYIPTGNLGQTLAAKPH
jgi:hypothetical protein